MISTKIRLFVKRNACRYFYTVSQSPNETENCLFPHFFSSCGLCQSLLHSMERVLLLWPHFLCHMFFIIIFLVFWCTMIAYSPPVWKKNWANSINRSIFIQTHTIFIFTQQQRFCWISLIVRRQRPNKSQIIQYLKWIYS